MPDIAFINGEFLPLSEARISVEDRGFQFGDGVYEVVRTYSGTPFRLEAHLARLARSAKAIDLPDPYEPSEWRRLVLEALTRAQYAESKVYIQITRGVAPRDHVYPPDTAPTVVMTVRELHPIDEAARAAGVSVMTTDDLRWARCDVKSLNLLANVLARQRARDAGVFEAVLVRDGKVMEGSVSNVMMVKAGLLITPPEGPYILSGVTRQVVLEAARRGGLPVEERSIALSEFRAADEVLLTGTTVEVLPVVRLDGRAVGSGRPGVTTGRVQQLFRQCVG